MRRTSIFIGCFLAVQLALPLSYYTCRNDKTDERFAWRMFSSTRHVQCKVQFLVGGRPYRLTKTFHESWSELASRNRKSVIRRMARRLCDDHDGKEVRVSVECSRLGGKYGKPSRGGLWDFCKTGSL